MSFEEDFPSYVKEEARMLSEIVMDETMLQSYERKDKARYKAMEKTCIDKQKLKEILEWLCFEKGKIDTANLDYIQNQFGLEDEK